MSERHAVLTVKFYRTIAGNEPVREWLTALPKPAKKRIGIDIKTVQIGWPLGMPVVRKMQSGLWEIRTDLGDTQARVFFTLLGTDMILLHGFVKKSQATPTVDLKTALARKSNCKELK